MSNALDSCDPPLNLSHAAEIDAFESVDINFASSVAEQYGRYGVRINTVNPGPVNTDRWDGLEKAFARDKNVDQARAHELAISSIPFHRIAEPHEGAGTSRPPPHERRGIGGPRLRDVREGHRFLDALFGREHEVRPRRGDARAKPVVSRVRGGGEGALDRGLGGVELAGEPADHAGAMQGDGEVGVSHQSLGRRDRVPDQRSRFVEASSSCEQHARAADSMSDCCATLDVCRR